MSALAKSYPSIEDYLAIEESSEIRHEYLNGEIVAMTGASIVHNQIKQNISRFLDDALDAQGCNLYTSDMRVMVKDTGAYMYPDVVVVCGDIEKETKGGESLLNPTIIIEILSHSTESYDRGLKWAYYKLVPSLEEYLLVSQNRPYVEQYTRQTDNSWRYVTYEGIDSQIVFPSVGAELSLRSLHRKVNLEIAE